MVKSWTWWPRGKVERYYSSPGHNKATTRLPSSDGTYFCSITWLRGYLKSVKRKQIDLRVKNKWGRSHSKSKEEINEGILQGNQRLLPETPTQRRKPENHAKTAEEKRDAAARRTELKRKIRVH